MAAVSVLFDTQEITRELKRLGAKIQNVPMSIISEALIAAIDDEIQSEGRGRWPVFSPVTLKLHPRREGGRLLQDTGLLANMQSTEGSNWVKVKSPARYSGFHVTGTTQRNIYRILAPHTMPKRDFLDIDLPRVLGEAVESILTEVTD